VARDDRPTPDAPPGGSRVRDVAPTPVCVAGVLVGLQALAAAVFTVALVLAGVTDLGRGPALGEAAFFLLVAAALAAVAGGLLTGRRWARTPALVTQLLLLPVVYSLLGPSHQVLLGLAAGAFVFATFMLLLNERSRLWSMGVDPADDPEAR
jgi:hypothetical protein